MSSLYKRLSSGQQDNNWQVQFFQHLVTGLIATAAHYLVMFVALTADIKPLLASSLGFIIGAITRFAFSYFHIFAVESHVSGALLRFITILGVHMLLNAGMLALFMAVGLPVWIAQFIATALLTVLNFLLAKYWVFK